MKKIIVLLLVATLSVGLLSGCGSDDKSSNVTSNLAGNTKQDSKESDTKKADSQKKDTQKDTQKEDTQKAEPQSKTTTLKDGYYLISMTDQASDWSKSYMKSYSMKDGVIEIEAAMNYAATQVESDEGNGKDLDLQKATILYDEKTLFSTAGGDSTVEENKMPAEQFAEYIVKCKNSGLALEIVIENGKAKQVVVCS